MTLQYAHGQYKPKNPEKYIGKGSIIYRSGWEFHVMKMLDENPAIQQWASESIKIPYRCPLTGKQTVYVPDFLVVYNDANNKQHAELWEVKPSNQAVLENVGRSKYNQAQYVKNQAKWEVARQFCHNKGLTFRIITEQELYFGTKPTKQQRTRRKQQ